MHKIFVYGTLKSGYGNNRLIEHANKLGEHTVEAGRYCLVDLGPFPAVMPVDEISGLAPTKVTGEVWEVDDQTFERVDGLEGYPHFYNREKIQTPFGEAWMYFMQDKHGRNESDICDNGVWPR